MTRAKPRSFLAAFLLALPDPVAKIARAMKRSMLNLRSRKAVFSKIARTNGWDGTESISGPGSTLEATSNIRLHLPRMLAKYNVQTFLDIPCGDAYWISKCLPENIKYIGADIVSELITRNRKEKSAIGEFQVLDLVSDRLPKSDMVMVRDCFIHLPNDVINSALENIKRAGPKYLLTTTYPGRADNIDIEIGGFRPIDLKAKPFNFPEPLEIILEFEGSTSGKSIALWDIANL